MEFFAVNGKRPIRLSNETRTFAFDSLKHKYGLETWGVPAVSMDDYKGFENLTPLHKYDAVIEQISKTAPIRICNGEKISGSATLGIVVVLLDLIDIGSHNALSAHHRKQIAFNTGQLHITGHKVNALVAVYDTEIIFKRFVVDNIPHNRCKRDVQFIRSLNTETDRQRTLRVSVDKQNLLTGVMKPDTEIQCRSGFTGASFLIFDCNYFAAHNIYLLFRFTD